MTIQEIKNAVKEMDPNLSAREEGFKFAVLLIAASQVGPTQPKLCELTRYPAGLVKKFLVNARTTGLIKGGKIMHSGWFDKDGGIAFWLDVAMAQGFIKRVEKKKAA